MKLSLIKIGNSKGFRIPKSVLQRYEISEGVELIFEEEQIVLRPITQPRQGWDEAFENLASEDDDLLIDEVFEDEDFEEWD